MGRLLWSHGRTHGASTSFHTFTYNVPLFLEYLPRTSEILLFLKTLFKHQLFVSARLPHPRRPFRCSAPLLPPSPQREYSHLLVPTAPCSYRK